MKLRRIFKPGNLIHNWIFWLVFITGLAIIIRSIPGWIYAAWGCDYGIYFGITKNIAATGQIFPPYRGWGSSYNEFPLAFLINAFAHWILGIDLTILMPRLLPIFGGLSVFVFYFFTYELVNDKKIALLATLFFAFLPFHVYQTSHSSPLTIAHFFMILSMYLFLKYRKNSKFIYPLIFSLILLVSSHHLTVYFYLIILIFIVFLENLTIKNWTATFKKDILYITIASLIVFLYWGLIARTVFDSFMQTGFKIGSIQLGPVLIIGVFYVLLFLIFVFLVFVKKYSESISKLKLFIINFYIEKLLIFKRKFVVFKGDKKFFNIYILKFLVALIVIYFIMVFFLFFEAPWIRSTITFEVILLSTPFLIVVAIGVTSIRYTYNKENGKFIVGWLLATLISLAYSLLSNNEILIPYRHFEYMMAPLAIIVVYGLGGIFSDPDYKELLTNINFKKKKLRDFSRKMKISNKIKILNIFVIIVLIVSLASTVYEVHKSFNASIEEITEQDINAIDWMSTNLDQNSSVIASDHRLSRIVEGYPYFFNTTKDQTENIWETETWYESIDELMGIGKNHSRITHIIIDDIMLNDVVHVHSGCSKYMINESRDDDTKYAAYYKFNNSEEPVFSLIYRNETIDRNPITYEPTHWIEIYEVNWSYIETVI